LSKSPEGLLFRFGLGDRPRREAQIDRAAGLVVQPVALGGFALGVALDVVEGEGEDRRELIDESRLEGGEPVYRS